MKYVKLFEDYNGGDTKKSIPEKGTPEWHQLQIAKKTVKMNPAMQGVMGGMTKEEAEKILDKYGIKESLDKVEQDKNKTKVQFLVHSDKGKDEDVFAYFPDEVDHDELRVCYSHVGQHSSCDPVYARESRKATPEEYKDLKKELEGQGYNLEIMESIAVEEAEETMKPATREMLEKLLKSGNKNCADLAKKILDGKSTIKYELQYAGGFMTAVLKGDKATAMERADGDNLKALEGE